MASPLRSTAAAVYDEHEQKEESGGDGDVWEKLIPATITMMRSLPTPRTCTGTSRTRGELEKLDTTLKHPGLIDLDVRSVADALAQKEAIEYVIAETERRCREAEETARLRREEEKRQLTAFRAAVASDPALRREVERRNFNDQRADIWKEARTWFGPLPGGFNDGLRHQL